MHPPKKYLILILISYLIIGFFTSCSKTTTTTTTSPTNYYKTENVIIIVMDGARYSETWGEPTHSLIPSIANNIAPKGVINNNFRNNGTTSTSPGHLAICSGQYYNLNNGGGQLPPFPTMFQYFNEKYPTKNSWIITSKDKLEVLANTSHTSYNNLHLPNTNCGINGMGSGYRADDITLNVVLNVFNTQHPNLTLINFREPDFTAHSNDSIGYIKQISNVDSLINIIFNFVENDSIYNGTTSIFITNDHGRHDNLNGGFAGHGDSCEGCRHLLFCAYGPDFKENVVINTPREQIDIAVTIAEILSFNLPNTNGQIMQELFK
ncbi:MAG: sulfatase [Flavobacteriales bacterium]|nr:MAG: sulfatase [Flavobacteriales bacterium]